MNIPPLETEDQARHLPSVAAIYDRALKSPGHGLMAKGNRDMLSAALEAAGVTLGAFEEHFLLGWLTQFEPSRVAVVAEVIRRAYVAGVAVGVTPDDDDG